MKVNIILKMASIILDKYPNACFNKIDNRKSRKILKKRRLSICKQIYK